MERPPQNMDELRVRVKLNSRITGHGIGNVWIEVPCPFCGAGEFYRYEMLQARKALEDGATCRECVRSAKVVHEDIPGGGVKFTLYQSGGDDPPDWLEPKIRRLP